MTLATGRRPWAGALGPLWWALMALRSEVLDFRFDYPLETVPKAGAKESLHYYVYSERLFFDAMELDAQGIPVQRSRTIGEVYNPAYVAWYGLMNLERSLQTGTPSGRAIFLRQAEWLEANRVRLDDGSVVWPYTFDWQEGDCFLQGPWVCAMAQGLGVSMLVRAYRITRDEHLLDLCAAGVKVFEKAVEDGGVRTLAHGHVLYEEYPGYPLPRVLDGFLFSLLGLYDLFAQTGDPRIFQLFMDGIDGLTHMVSFWDYRGKWSWYGSHGYLCPPKYNKLNAALLGTVARLADEPTLHRYAASWDPSRLSAGKRAEVFLAFLFTKNRCRFKHLRRRWRRH